MSSALRTGLGCPGNFAAANDPRPRAHRSGLAGRNTSLLACGGGIAPSFVNRMEGDGSSRRAWLWRAFWQGTARASENAMNVNQLLHGLGFPNYAAYLKSPHWYSLRRKWIETGRPAYCQICGSSSFQLHHTTYIRLGREELHDFMALCDDHHSHVHQILKANNKSVESTYWAARQIKSDFVIDSGQSGIKKSRKSLFRLRKNLCVGCGKRKKKLAYVPFMYE